MNAAADAVDAAKKNWPKREEVNEDDDAEQLLHDHRLKLGRTKRKHSHRILTSGLHASHTTRAAPPAPLALPSAAEEEVETRHRQDARRRVDMGALRAAVAEQDAEVAGIERERAAMTDPAASTFANVSRCC